LIIWGDHSLPYHGRTVFYKMLKIGQIR